MESEWAKRVKTSEHQQCFTSCRPGCKADYNCLKIMNASGPGQSRGRGSGGQRPPEAEAFLSQSMPKTQSPGTLALNHVYLLYSNNN